MCTVTLIPINASENSFVLTSNRDESPLRKTLPPAIYSEEGVRLIYPKDALAGGTWIGTSEAKRTLCLLNGAFEKHDRNPPYRLSRGVVVRDLLTAENIDTAIQDYNLERVEPFTLIISDYRVSLRFLELVWDGQQKHLKDLGFKEYIWSSSPLYSEEMKRQRMNWFENFLKGKETSAEALLEFHYSAGAGDKEVGLIMDRGVVGTQSITQVVHSGEKTKMRYEDLRSGKISEVIL